MTKKKLWLITSRNSLLFQPGMTILSNRHRFQKNSLFSSTRFRALALNVEDVEPERWARRVATETAAAFCSEMAERTRLIRAKTRVT